MELKAHHYVGTGAGVAVSALPHLPSLLAVLADMALQLHGLSTLPEKRYFFLPHVPKHVGIRLKLITS